MIAHAPVDPGLLPVHRAGERPVDAVGAQILAILGGQVGARGKIMSATEMSVAGAGQDRAAYGAVLPEVDPGRGDVVRHPLVEDIGLGRVVERDVGDPVALFVVERHIDLPE